MMAALAAATMGTSLAVGAGAYIGAGGPLPNARDISFKGGKGFGDWKAGPPQALDEGFAMQVALAVATAGISKMASYGKSAFMAKFFPSVTGAIPGMAIMEPAVAPSFMRQFVGGAVFAGMAGYSNAKSRQNIEDMMMKQRQRTGS